jgi:hypothetical protein
MAMDTLTLLELQAEGRSVQLHVVDDAMQMIEAEGHLLGFSDRLVWLQSSAGGGIVCDRWSQVRELRAA